MRRDPQLRFLALPDGSELRCSRCEAPAQWEVVIELETEMYTSVDDEAGELGQLAVCALCRTCGPIGRDTEAAIEATLTALKPPSIDIEDADEETSAIVACVRSLLIGADKRLRA